LPAASLGKGCATEPLLSEGDACVLPGFDAAPFAGKPPKVPWEAKYASRAALFVCDPSACGFNGLA
jgi:hypothetical protein